MAWLAFFFFCSLIIGDKNPFCDGWVKRSVICYWQQSIILIIFKSLHQTRQQRKSHEEWRHTNVVFYLILIEYFLNLIIFLNHFELIETELLFFNFFDFVNWLRKQKTALPCQQISLLFNYGTDMDLISKVVIPQ